MTYIIESKPSFSNFNINENLTESESITDVVDNIDISENTFIEQNSLHSNEAAIDLKYGLLLSTIVFITYFIIGIGYYHGYVKYSVLDTVFFLSTTFLGIGYEFKQFHFILCFII